MPRIEIRKEETHRDRFYSLRLQCARRLSHLLLVQRHQHFSLRGNETLGHDLALPAPSQGAVLPGDFLLNGIVLGTLVTTNMEDVTIPFGCNHTNSRTFILQQGVGCDGGTVIDPLNIGEINPNAFTEV